MIFFHCLSCEFAWTQVDLFFENPTGIEGDVMAYDGGDLPASSADMFEIMDYTLNSGRAKGVRCIGIDCGKLEFTLLADRCLDIYKVKYEGKQLAFLSKNGVVAPQYYDPRSYGWLESFSGGLVVTCGLANVGEPCEFEGKSHGLHGRISNTPAENVNITRYGKDIVVSGIVRETSLMGCEYELRREVRARVGGNTIELCDTITNHTEVSMPLMLLYHINFGGDLLQPGTMVRIPGSTAVEPFDEHAAVNMAQWHEVGVPVSGAPEQVFLHSVKTGDQGFGEFSISNGETGVVCRYSAAELPKLGLWKCLRPDEYAIALEPCNNHIRGLSWEQEHGKLRVLASKETARTQIAFTFKA